MPAVKIRVLSKTVRVLEDTAYPPAVAELALRLGIAAAARGSMRGPANALHRRCARIAFTIADRSGERGEPQEQFG
jgi:hypothetical protein